MSYLDVTRTITEQLGGERRLRITIGARAFMPDAGRYGLGRLSISIPSNLTRPRINLIRVELTPGDVYEVACDYVSRDAEGKPKVKEIALAHNVYVDDLAEVIRRLTGGLEIRMPKIEVQS